MSEPRPQPIEPVPPALAEPGSPAPDVPAAPPPHRRRRWPVVLAAVLVLIVVLVAVASRITLNDYALTPGQAQPVGPLVKVPSGKAHHPHGPILLTDVYVTPVSLLDYLPTLLDSDAQIVSAGELLGPDTPPDQLTTQGYLEMAQSQAAAKAASLTRLGYDVPEHDAGALVFAVQPGSPAGPHLQVGQIVTAVNGHATADDCAFIAALHPYGPGETVELSVEQSTVTADGVIRSGRTVDERVRLGRRPSADDQSSGCPGVHGASAGYLGVVVETQQDFDYPFPIAVDTSEIGGPSAGLAMTLGIIDTLSSGHLTGGRTIAATGTITPTGAVGDVGGVAQKTVAVERAGATVFLVPPEELAAAKSKDVPSLHIYAVSSLDQALAVLRRLGGHVPPAPVRPAETPHPTGATS
jgi:Lon-like protease